MGADKLGGFLAITTITISCVVRQTSMIVCYVVMYFKTLIFVCSVCSVTDFSCIAVYSQHGLGGNYEISQYLVASTG